MGWDQVGMGSGGDGIGSGGDRMGLGRSGCGVAPVKMGTVSMLRLLNVSRFASWLIKCFIASGRMCCLPLECVFSQRQA